MTPGMAISSILLSLSVLFAGQSKAGYTLVDDYSGVSFFSDFDFFTGPDPTSGFVQFVDEATANSTGLVGIMNGGAAHEAVYLGVDHTNVTPSGRPSVRVSSKKSYSHGLVIADIAHMPGGICGTWPAFWMFGSGEIDIIEGVNAATGDAMTLHTNSGCSISPNTGFIGKLTTSNCDVNAPGQEKNAGCQVANNNTASYGAGFNAAGGGVYATEWTSTFIKIWFFGREAGIPGDITAGKPSPSSAWGPPVAQFQGDCQIDQRFKNMLIVFDTTFCGQWAGEVWASSSCGSLASTCNEYVEANPSVFTDAYWTIHSVKVYEQTQQNEKMARDVPNRTGGSVLPV